MAKDDDGEHGLSILNKSEEYPPKEPTDWFCIRGRQVVVLADAEIVAVLKNRHPATNKPKP